MFGWVLLGRAESVLAVCTMNATAAVYDVRQTAPRHYDKCRGCGVVLGLDDDRVRGICADTCAKRQDVRRRLIEADARDRQQAPSPAKALVPATERSVEHAKQKRPFTIAEKSLIRNMHHVLPPADLLRILNDRLVADVGPDVPLWTLEQLHTAIATQQQVEQANDWTNLRDILRTARSCGVLAQITPQVLDDFSVVYQLSPAQRMHLIDVIRSAKEV